MAEALRSHLAFRQLIVRLRVLATLSPSVDSAISAVFALGSSPRSSPWMADPSAEVGSSPLEEMADEPRILAFASDHVVSANPFDNSASGHPSPSLANVRSVEEASIDDGARFRLWSAEALDDDEQLGCLRPEGMILRPSDFRHASLAATILRPRGLLFHGTPRPLVTLLPAHGTLRQRVLRLSR